MFGEFLSAHALNLACYGAFVAIFAGVERLRPVERQSPRAFLFNLSLFSLLYLGLSGYYYEMSNCIAMSRISAKCTLAFPISSAAI